MGLIDILELNDSKQREEEKWKTIKKKQSTVGLVTIHGKESTYPNSVCVWGGGKL